MNRIKKYFNNVCIFGCDNLWLVMSCIWWIFGIMTGLLGEQDTITIIIFAIAVLCDGVWCIIKVIEKAKNDLMWHHIVWSDSFVPKMLEEDPKKFYEIIKDIVVKDER